MTPPMPIVADAARPVVGPDDATAAIRIVVARRIDRRVVAAIAVEVPAVVMEVRPVGIVRTIMIAAAMEHRPRAESAVKGRAAAVEDGTRTTASEGVAAAAMERRATAAAVEGRSAVKSTAGMSAAATPAMAAGSSDLNGQHVGGRLRRRPGAGTHRRHRKRRPAGRAGQEKQCRRRKTEATSQTSALVLHPHHGPFSLNAVQRWTHAAPMLVVRSVELARPNMNVEIAT